MRPTLRATIAMLVGLGVALLPVLVSARLWTVWIAYVGLVLLAIGADAILALPRRRLAVQTHAPDKLYIGDEDSLAVTLTARRARRPVSAELLVDMEGDLEPQPAGRVEIPAGEPAKLTIPLIPHRRGIGVIVALWLRWTGPLGLVERRVRRAIGTKIPVVPNVRAVRAAAIRFFSSREMLAGLKVERYLGDGSEFESLREYVPGMDHRAMDWKSSARHRKLLVQEFRAERNHQIVIAIDTGHLMREPLGGVPRLDHAINAGLLLGYFGLRTGDRVGLYGFDERARTWAEPQGGVGTFDRLQLASSELDYSTSETNFTLGLAELSTHLRRRSLVVVMTDFVDSVTAELMVENLDRLARRHLVLFVTLRDPGPAEIASRAPRSIGDVYRAVVAGDFVRERDVVLRRLARLGILTVDAPPDAVSARMLNRYLEIKRREMV